MRGLAASGHARFVFGGGYFMRNLWRAVVLGAALAVVGCTAFQVISFRSTDDSFKRRSERISMLVSGMPQSNAAGLGAAEVKIPGAEGDFIRARCGLPSLVRDPSGTSAPTAIPAALIVALAGVLIDAGITKLNEYTDKKIKEFKHQYSGRINVPDFSLPKNAENRAAPRTRCIFFERKVNIAVEGKESDNIQTALFMVLEFQPVGRYAYTLKPIYLDLTYSGARTSEDGKAVDLEVSVGISVVRQTPGGNLVNDLVSIQNFSLRKIRVRGTESNRPDYGGKFEAGTIIPALSDTTAATVVVAVTETGDGAEEFGQFRKDTDAYGKVLKDFGLEQLKDLLGAK
jgi:hypothetical protein